MIKIGDIVISEDFLAGMRFIMTIKGYRRVEITKEAIESWAYNNMSLGSLAQITAEKDLLNSEERFK